MSSDKKARVAIPVTTTTAIATPTPKPVETIDRLWFIHISLEYLVYSEVLELCRTSKKWNALIKGSNAPRFMQSVVCGKRTFMFRQMLITVNMHVCSIDTSMRGMYTPTNIPRAFTNLSFPKLTRLSLHLSIYNLFDSSTWDALPRLTVTITGDLFHFSNLEPKLCLTYLPQVTSRRHVLQFNKYGLTFNEPVDNVNWIQTCSTCKVVGRIAYISKGTEWKEFEWFVKCDACENTICSKCRLTVCKTLRKEVLMCEVCTRIEFERLLSRRRPFRELNIRRTILPSAIL
jgi:hypothetical protein